MDLINKYLNLNENKPLFPGTPEYKKKFDPSYNPYDPEGKVKKALKLKPYGYRDSKPASDEDETPSQQPAMKKRGRPKKMQSEQKNNLPFTPDKPKKPSAVAGKYGAGYSTARHLARMGLRDALKDLKKGPEAGKRQVEEVEPIEELKRSTLASYTGKAADQMAHASIDKSSGAAMGTMGRMSNMPDLAKKGSDKEDKAFQTILKRTKGITSASKRLAKEEADLDEATPSAMQVKQGIGIARDKRYAKGNVTGAVRAMNKVNPGLAQHPVVKKELQKQNENVDIFLKYTKLSEAKFPGFRVRMTSGGPKLPRRSYVPQGDQDPRTGMPLGFSPIKDEPKKSDPSKKTKQG